MYSKARQYIKVHYGRMLACSYFMGMALVGYINESIMGDVLVLISIIAITSIIHVSLREL